MANVTIKDVARVAHVSVATVSRALNGHSNVADDVRRRVIEAAKSLRYTPHAGARSLSSRRTHTLGVVLPDLCGELFGEMARSFEQAAREHGLHLLVSSYRGHANEHEAVLRAMRSRVDGLLVMTPFVAGSTQLLAELGDMPAVLINSRPDTGGVAMLNVDNHAGALVMMEHLVERGHRRIAFIDGPAFSFDAHERRRGYRDALARWLPHATEWIVPGDFDEGSGFRAGQQLLQSPDPPDAVFAANDTMALGCRCAFAQAGVRVPQQIALAGFDDIPLARYSHPGLTTMRVEMAGLGKHAVRLLLARMGDNPGPPESLVVTPQLIVRESTWAGPSKGLKPS